MLTTARRRTTTAAAGLSLLLAAATTAFIAPATAAPGPGDVRRDFAADATTLGAVADGTGCGTAEGAPRDVAIPVSGLRPEVVLTDLEVTVELAPHNWMADISVVLISPDGGTSFPVFGRTLAATPTSCGDSTNLGGVYTFSDQATDDWSATAAALDSATAMPSGTYRSSEVGSPGTPSLLTPAFAAVPDLNGAWTLRVTDASASDTTSVLAASLGLTVDETCPDARDALASAQMGLSVAQGDLAAAASLQATATKALKKAKKQVAKAKKKLAKAKKASANRKAKVKKATKVLRAKKAAAKKKTKKLRAAKAVTAAAQVDVEAAEAAVAQAQGDVDGACPVVLLRH